MENIVGESKPDTLESKTSPALKDGRAASAAPIRAGEKHNWPAVVAFVASGKSLSEAARAFKIPIGTMTGEWTKHPDWPRPSREVIRDSKIATRTENFLKSQAPDFVANIQERMKEKAAVFCELAGEKLVKIAEFTSGQHIESRKDAMADTLILKTAAQAAETVMGMKKETPQSQVMVNISMNHED